MFVEAVEFFFTPTSPIAKKYGFLYSSIALKHRYERCKKLWIPHLQNCQELFREICETLPQKNHVVILGSSHLHEIPLHLLFENFTKVTLVDVIHPLKHHRLAKKNPRLELVTQDLTEALDRLGELQSLEDLDRLAKELSEQKLFYFEADLIVSGNLLSQLALLPLDAIERKIKKHLTLEEKDLICTQFANTHLKNLSACKGKKLIYADREVIYRDPKSEVIYTGHYPVDFTSYEKLKEWIWLLAPLKEASKDYSIEMKIEAYSR